VLSGTESVAELAEIHELRDLRFAYNQLRTVLDGPVGVRKPVRERVSRTVGPVDDLDVFAFEEIHQTHAVQPPLDVSAVSDGASTLRCPSCGAPAAPDAGRCAYCQARLATIGCPTCMALLFQGAAFCPACGAARSRAEEAQPHSTKCPACRGDMHWIRVGDVDLLECANCDGTWIEAEAFDRLCVQREHQAAIAHTRAPVKESAASAAPVTHVRYRPCPQCGKMMNRQNFGRLSGTIVDICSGHGTFLDRGELHQVVKFILAGGFTRTRQAELDRIKEEQRRLRELELHLSRQRGQN
jgi:Zn-finger nucleic acid-binding protein